MILQTWTVLSALGRIGVRTIGGLVAVLTVASAAGAEPGPAASILAPARVHAVYHISWNGLELGDFTWDSSIGAGQYKAVTSASISALLGAYSWEGATRASGSYLVGEPHPSAYRFKFRSTDKSGRVDMTFLNNKVVKTVEDPPDRGAAGRVPLLSAHLENVLDPISAIVALSSPGTTPVDKANACEKHLSIFDGRQRFDLVLSNKRKVQLDGSIGAKWAYVCRVQYVPIAGHKNNAETNFMATTDGIEIWLAPVGFANAFVPVTIIVPTPFGSAQITSSRVQIDMPRKGRVAFNAR